MQGGQSPAILVWVGARVEQGEDGLDVAVARRRVQGEVTPVRRVRVGARVEQCDDGLDVPAARRRVQGGVKVPARHRVRVGAALEQCDDGLDMAEVRRNVQGGVTLAVLHVWVDAGIKQFGDGRGVVSPGGIVQGEDGRVSGESEREGNGRKDLHR